MLTEEQKTQQILKNLITDLRKGTRIDYRTQIYICIRNASFQAKASLKVSDDFIKYLEESGKYSVLSNTNFRIASKYLNTTADLLENGKAILVNLDRNKSFEIRLK